MRTVTLTLRNPHAAQRAVLADARRFNVVCCGRRFGKTALCINVIVEPALAGKPVGWFAPTYKILVPAWRELVTLLAPITTRRNDAERRLELVTGGVVEMWSLDDPDGCRGRAYARIVIDEAARVVHLERAWTEVIRPTLTDYRGDAWFPSTPRGLNFFHTLWQRGQDPANGEWASWQMPTTANPYIAPAEVETARNELPAQVFAQEYEAAFIADGANVFRRVRDAATADPQDGPIDGHDYLVSIDWGKHRDWTVLAVWDATLGHLVHLDRFQQIDYQLQLGRLRAVCDRFRPFALAPERNSMGEPLIEQVAREPWCPPLVLPFTTTNASKALAVEGFALALEQGAVRILDEPVLVGELQAFAAERLPSGMLRYAAPEGMTDDCVMAAIIGWHALSGGLDGAETVVYDEPVAISNY
jgi:hypothetical protein